MKQSRKSEVGSRKGTDATSSPHAHIERLLLLPNSEFRIPNWPASRGITLVELLIVITILALVTAATIPIMAPAVESRRIRESARLVSGMFTSAQTRAIAAGRPVGIWIERMDPATVGSNASVMIFLCEVPPPYAGDTTDAKIRITDVSVATSWKGRLTDSNSVETLPVSPGDFIKINYQGPLYQIKTLTRINADEIEITFYRSGYPTPARTPPGSAGVPYQIYRQPEKTSEAPLQLPDSIVIDLTWSGPGSGFFQRSDPPVLTTPSPPRVYPPTRPVIFTFNQSGSLDYMYDTGDPPVRVTSPIHFLVGKREKVPAPDNPLIGSDDEPEDDYVYTDAPDVQAEKHNWKDMENLWVSVQPHTGMVTTSNVASVVDKNWLPDALVPATRRFATDSRSIGGR